MKPKMVVLQYLLQRHELKWCLKFKSISGRLMMIKLQKDKRTVVVVSAYAPQQGLTNTKKTWLSLVVTLMDM